MTENDTFDQVFPSNHFVYFFLILKCTLFFFFFSHFYAIFIKFHIKRELLLFLNILQEDAFTNFTAKSTAGQKFKKIPYEQTAALATPHQNIDSLERKMTKTLMIFPCLYIYFYTFFSKKYTKFISNFTNFDISSILRVLRHITWLF